MLATSTFRSMRCENRIAAMTSPSNFLPGLSADKILATGARGECQFVLFERRLRGLGLLRKNVLQRCSGAFLLVLRLGCWVSRALLAADVLAINADLVGAERSLAAMAVSSDSHANGLGDALNRYVAGGLPLAGLQSHSILGEQDPGLFLLNRSPVSQHGGFRGGSGFRFGLAFGRF